MFTSDAEADKELEEKILKCRKQFKDAVERLTAKETPKMTHSYLPYSFQQENTYYDRLHCPGHYGYFRDENGVLRLYEDPYKRPILDSDLMPVRGKKYFPDCMSKAPTSKKTKKYCGGKRFVDWKVDSEGKVSLTKKEVGELLMK